MSFQATNLRFFEDFPAMVEWHQKGPQNSRVSTISCHHLVRSWGHYRSYPDAQKPHVVAYIPINIHELLCFLYGHGLLTKSISAQYSYREYLWTPIWLWSNPLFSSRLNGRYPFLWTQSLLLQTVLILPHPFITMVCNRQVLSCVMIKWCVSHFKHMQLG